jgi:hypothetical protein
LKRGFSSVDYIDDIVLGTEEQEKDDVVEFDESSMDISIQLDYGDYIKEYIMKQKYESDKFKDGVVDEFDEIIKIYNENYTKIKILK